MKLSATNWLLKPGSARQDFFIGPQHSSSQK